MRRYSCWCPKVIATIGHLPDALSDRCIMIRMQRKTAHEACARLRDLKAEPLRQQCQRFVTENAEKISAARSESEPSLNDRAADVWDPLFVLADIAGGDWPQRARTAAAVLAANAQDNNPIGSLLLDIWAILHQAPENRIFTRDLVAWLNTFTWRPWYEAREGKPITDLWLAAQLRPYGIKPRTVWIGNIHAKGYAQEDLADTFRRYISAADLQTLKAESAAEKPPQKKSEPPNGTSLSA